MSADAAFSSSIVECESATAVALSPDGARICLARAGSNGAAIVLTSSALQSELEATRGSEVMCVDWAVDGSRVASAGRAQGVKEAVVESKPLGFVSMSDASDGSQCWAVQRDAPVTSIVFSVDVNNALRLACTRVDGYVEILDAFQGEALQIVRLRGFAERWSHRSPFAGISPDRPLPPRDPNQVATPCLSVAWSARGDFIAVARTDGVALVNLTLASTPGTMYGGQAHNTGTPSALQSAASQLDDAEDDAHAVLRELKLSCGSAARCCALASVEADEEEAKQGAAAAAAAAAGATDSTAEEIKAEEEHLTMIYNERHVLAFCGGTRLVLADAESGKVIADHALETSPNGKWAAANSLAFVKTVKAPRIVLGGELEGGAGVVAIFDATNGALIAVQRARSAVLSISTSVDGRFIAAGERKSTPELVAEHAAYQAQQAAVPMETEGPKFNIPAPTLPTGIPNFVSVDPPPVPEEKKPIGILDHLMELHRNKLKKLLDENDLFKDKESATVVLVRKKIDEFFATHHEMVEQLFAAERAVADWKANQYLMEPPAQEDDGHF